MSDENARPEEGGAQGGLVSDVVGRRLIQEVTDLALFAGAAVLVFLVADRGYEWVVASYPSRFSSAEQGDEFMGWLDAVDALRTAFPYVLIAWWLIYFVVVPWLLGARTPGMLIMRLTMARADGSPAGFSAILVRAIGVAIESAALVVLGAVVLDLRVAVVVVALVVPLLVVVLTAEHVRFAEHAARVLVVWSPRGEIARR